MTRLPNPALCRHSLFDREIHVTGLSPYVTWERCRRCGETIPAGPSNDAPPEVQQEIRAAEIAADAASADPYRPLAVDESRGWWVVEPPRTGHDNAWHAGYLARAIVEHEE